MRTRQIRALALSVLLAVALSTVPAIAAPSRDDGDPRTSPVVKLVKRIAKFVISALDEYDLTLPHP